ncbi:MAG: hypothetical protein GX607_04815 [Myxococcales bacterium]|jgi:hypothetical protein|nr:hypothetical protein [Myxococcales bacterium]
MTYVSELDGSGDRFLSRCLQQILGESWVTPADFVASFGPSDIMESLEGATELRARILIEAAGVHEKIAPKKSTQAAAEDLQISLDEGICDPPRLLELFSADDRVRYLERQRLWDFVTRDEFWKKPSEKARARMVFVLATALEEKLIDLGDLIDGVGSERLAKDLPKGLLEQVLVRAVSDGRAGKPFDPAGLFEVVQLPDWVAHVSLEHLWANVVQSRIEPAAGFDDDGIALVSDTDIAPVDGDEPPPAGPPPSKGKGGKGSSGKKGGNPPASGPAAKAAPGAGDGAASADGERDAAELAARQRAVDTLAKIGRLPPRHEALDTATLLAIDSLYVDLAPLTTDEAREECIREAFPNDAMLRGALLALAEVLDPNIDIAALEKDADADSLIKLVLFEERRKADRSRRSLTPPPPAGAPPASGRASSAPPPLPPLPPPPSGQRPSSPPPPALPEAAGGPPGRR